jgi:hypothetical protein
MSNQPKLFLSSPGGTGKEEELFHSDSVVIVNANGSGKSRLEAWIEKTTGIVTCKNLIA